MAPVHSLLRTKHLFTRSQGIAELLAGIRVDLAMPEVLDDGLIVPVRLKGPILSYLGGVVAEGTETVPARIDDEGCGGVGYEARKGSGSVRGSRRGSASSCGCMQLTTSPPHQAAPARLHLNMAVLVALRVLVPHELGVALVKLNRGMGRRVGAIVVELGQNAGATVVRQTEGNRRGARALWDEGEGAGGVEGAVERAYVVDLGGHGGGGSGGDKKRGAGSNCHGEGQELGEVGE